MRWLISPSGRSLVAGVVFGMVFEVSVLVLAFDLVVTLYDEIFNPKDRPENHAVRLFDLVKCEAGDEPVGERTVALFVEEQGFFLYPNPEYLVDDRVADFHFSSSDLVSLTMRSTDKRHLLEIHYDYFPNADPGPKTVTARDMARFERAGFRPSGYCDEGVPQPP